MLSLNFKFNTRKLGMFEIGIKATQLKILYFVRHGQSRRMRIVHENIYQLIEVIVEIKPLYNI